VLQGNGLKYLLTWSTGIAGLGLGAETFWKDFQLSQSEEGQVFSRLRFNSVYGQMVLQCQVVILEEFSMEDTKSFLAAEQSARDMLRRSG
jgi:hypothetical protein